MKATVNRDECIGCGICESYCPDVYTLDEEGKSEVILDPIPAELEACAQEGADACPVSVITIEA